MAIDKKPPRGFDAAEHEASVKRIPTGVNNPTPAADGLNGDTNLSRNINNSLNALGGMGVVASVPLKAAQAGQGVARGMMNAAPILPNGVARLAAPAAASAPDFIAGATGVAKAGGANLPSVINAPVAIPIAKTVNAGLQEGAQANQLAAATRGFSGASAGLTAADAQQSAPAIAALPGAAVAATTPAAANPSAVGLGGADEGVIPGTRAVMNGFADDANRNIKEGNYGALAGNTIKATATMPFALAADAARPVTSRLEGVGRGFYNAASTLFGGSENAGNAVPAGAPSTPAAIAQPAAPAVSAGPAATAPATAPATPAAPANPNLVTRVGNSYSGGPNIKGDIELAGNRGGMISAQDNQAAENLARKYGQTTGFGPAGEISGGGQVSSINTSAGYAADLKQLAGIEAAKSTSVANMRDQENYAAMKAGHLSPKAYQATLTANQVDQTARRGQDIHASSLNANEKLAQDKLGLEKAKDGREATSAGFASRSAQRVESLQAAYESAKPEDKAGIAEQIRVMTGKEKAPQWHGTPIAGTKNPDGSTNEGDLALYNPQTGEVKRASKAVTQAPPLQNHIDALKKDPKLAQDFDRQYGAGSSSKILGTK